MHAIPFGLDAPSDQDAMLRALDDADEGRAAASLRVVTALAALAPERCEALAEALAARVFAPGPVARRAALADALAALGAPHTLLLVAELEGPLADHRHLAARALASPRHRGALSALRARVGDEYEDERVRAASAVALARAASTADHAVCTEVLVRAAGLRAAELRRACADALGQLPLSRESGAALARLCADEVREVRVAALSALVVVGGTGARQAALSALGRPDPATQAVALVLLARHGLAEDAARARAHLDAEDARVRRAARTCQDALAC